MLTHPGLPRPHRLLTALMAGLMGTLVPQIQSQGADTPLTVTLVSEVTSIQPGQPFYVGLRLQHGTGYHTYWKFPGIVGVPTGIVWTLPPGFTAGEIEWPEPQSVLMFRIKAQGFERDVLLPIKITPPSDLKAGQTIRLSGKSSWMSCARSCHPGFTEVSLSLPVKSEPPAADAKWQPVFAQERSRYPVTTTAWKTTATETGETVTLTVTPAGAAAQRLPTAQKYAPIYFFTQDGWIDSDKPQVATLNADGSLTLVLTRSEVYLGKGRPSALHGILQNPAGWLTDAEVRSIQISTELKR